MFVAGSLHQMLGTRPEIIYERHHRLLGANLALQPEKEKEQTLLPLVPIRPTQDLHTKQRQHGGETEHHMEWDLSYRERVTHRKG
jgi:hypothetical protein